MIEYSVQMPMFRVKYIAWLALESLCRQEGITFEWELIMAEEQIGFHVGNEVFGIGRVNGYKERLESVGCSRIHYIPLNGWIPLAKKMGLLVDNCSKSSKYLMFQSADYYSSPYIMADSYNMFEDNPDIDWFTSKPYTIFYDIQSGISRMSTNGTKGSGRVVRIEPARRIAPSLRRRGCDKWFIENYRKKLGHSIREYVDEKQWIYAFNVNGFHNCTLSRGQRMISRPKKWKKIPFDWTTNIPNDIFRRVKKLKKFIPEHALGLPKVRLSLPDKKVEKVEKVVSEKAVRLGRKERMKIESKERQNKKVEKLENRKKAFKESRRAQALKKKQKVREDRKKKAEQKNE